MHGLGNLDNDGKNDNDPQDDVDVEKLLSTGNSEDIIEAIGLLHERYGMVVWTILRRRFPGFSDDIADIYQAALLKLLELVDEDRIQKEGGARGLLALLIGIAIFTAINWLRRDRRRRTVVLDDSDCVGTVRFDDPHDLADLLRAIREYISSKLNEFERVVLETFVRLVCEGRATETGRIRLSELTDEVNKAICPQLLSKKNVRAFFRSGRKKLRGFLTKKGIFK